MEPLEQSESVGLSTKVVSKQESLPSMAPVPKGEKDVTSRGKPLRIFISGANVFVLDIVVGCTRWPVSVAFDKAKGSYSLGLV